MTPRARAASWSLRRRLTLIAGAAMIASIAFGGVAMYWAASIESDQMLDASLEQLGATVLSFVEQDMSDGTLDTQNKPGPLKTRPSASLLYRYQVWSRQGELLMRSHEAPADVPLVGLSRLGFSTVQIEGESYRVLALPSSNKAVVVQVAENIDEQWREVGSVTAYYMSFLLVPFAIVFGVAWTMLQRSLGSVQSMADQLSDRNPLNLSPIDVHDPPREMLPIIESIDHLFERVGHALSTERRFTSFAAHEMRTPLAGLRVQSQLASRASDEDDRQDALAALRLGVDRASHLLDQLLDLARIEALPTEGAVPMVRLNISDVFQDVMNDLGARALARQVVVHARFDADELRAHRAALYVLLRNLIANAIAYSPVAGSVQLRSEESSDALALTVDDNGPGIAAADRVRAFERFNRLGQIRTQGVGLGLSIALAVAEFHRAKIELQDSPLGGLRVAVRFPPIAAASAPTPADNAPPR